MTEAAKSGLLDLEKELTCSICTEVLYQPLTLLDCLHTFCGSCLKDWFSFQATKATSQNQHPFTCPSCRSSVRDTRPNATVTTLLEMYLQANPGRARTAQEKAEMDQKYTSGQKIMPEVRVGSETNDEAEDRRMVDEVREMSLRGVGIRGSASYERGVRHRVRESPAEPQNNDRTSQSTESEDGGLDNAMSAGSQARQIGHQSSLRSLLSASDLDPAEMEEEILRQIREEGILDGIDLNNMTVSQEDELSEKIADAYRRRHRHRTRNHGGSSHSHNASHSRDRRANSHEQSHHRSGRSPNSDLTGQITQSSHPPLSRPHLLEAYPTGQGHRRRTSSDNRRNTSPTPSSRGAAIEAQRQAARSATDLSTRTQGSAHANASLSSRIPDRDGLRLTGPTQDQGQDQRPRSTQGSRSPRTRPREASSTRANSGNELPPRSSPRSSVPDLPFTSPRQSTNLNQEGSQPNANSQVASRAHSEPSADIARPLQSYPEPKISCERCGRPNLEYELHEYCSKCKGGTYNLCLSCYRTGRGCLYWFGFGYMAMQRYQRQEAAAGHPSVQSPPHRLRGHRYLPPPPETQNVAMSASVLSTSSDPALRLQNGPFCSNCSNFTPECYWKCEMCNEAEWVYCNKCVNQGKCCTHALLPVAYVSSHDAPKSVPLDNSQHSIVTAIDQPHAAISVMDSSADESNVEREIPLTFSTKCDICTYPIPPSSTRFHCPQCNEGDYDIDTTCYHRLVHTGKISLENGPRGWRRCLKGHRMVIVGFEDSNLGQRRIVVEDLVGGHALKDDIERISEYEWTWRGSQGQRQGKIISKAATARTVASSGPSATDTAPPLLKRYPPNGGVGMHVLALWAWWPADGASDELAFPKGAEIRECEDINGDCSRALFPQGNKATTITTSPTKKRKLSPPDLVQDPSNASETSSPPALVSVDTSTNLPSSPSQPRYIPQHLVLEGARSGRSPTPEPSNTAGSSPSGAYASLTIDSDGYTSGAETANKRRGSIASSGLRGGVSSPVRSTSPVKRRASTMTNDDVNMADGQDSTMESDPASKVTQADSGAGSKRRSKNINNRHKRETSVDMLGQETELASGASSTSSTFGDMSGPSSTSSAATVEAPSIDDQIKSVMDINNQPMEEGQTGFIVANKWLQKVLARGSNATGTEKYGKEALEGDIGPVDNSRINLVIDLSSGGFKDEKGEPFVPLKPGLQVNEDFEILPQTAWDLIMKWYGLCRGSPVIRRYCHNTSTSETQEHLQYEVNPPVFTILKLPDPSEGTTPKTLEERSTAPVKLLASRHERYQFFLRRAKESAGIAFTTKVRVWRILGGLGRSSGADGMITPAQSRSNSPAPGSIVMVDPGDKLVVDVNTFAGLQLGTQREEIDAKDETANDKYNGRSTLDFVGLRSDEVIVLEEQIGGVAGGEWVSDNAMKIAKTLGVPISTTKPGVTTVHNQSLKPGANASRSTSPAPSGIMTRGRQTKSGRTRGSVGLTNLGNTCYMNSALQCVRSVRELTEYFLEDKYKKELNPQNPLSHNGQVAKSYASLLHEIYSPNAQSAFAPRNFKNVIGKYGPSFSGYGQQDSQEFLLFLLDGLQEDLNRIHKKPYIEKPDSTDEMVNDQVALQEMADKCWEIYKARNDSVITDLFAGMYKSTVRCPICEKVSIIFDPFNNLTLQLPIESLWSKRIHFFPLGGEAIYISVDIDKVDDSRDTRNSDVGASYFANLMIYQNATFMALKEYVAGKVKVDPKRMVVAESYKSKIYKTFDDKVSLNEETIADSDVIGIWELEDQPTNFPQPKKNKVKSAYYYNVPEEEPFSEGDTILDERMLVAIIQRRKGVGKFQSKELFGFPAFIIVKRDEARDYDAILRKVLARVATMTSRKFLQEASWDEGYPFDSNAEDSDTVLMSTDEADSSADSRVQATSLGSEDGMVDISMRADSERGPQQKSLAPNAQELEGQFRSTPSMLRTGSFITPEVRNLFEMKVHPSNGRQSIPTGLNSIEEGKNYYTLTSRRQTMSLTKRKLSVQEEINRRQQNLYSPVVSDEEIDDALPPAPSQAAPENSGSDSEGLPTVEQLTLPTTNNFGNPASRSTGTNPQKIPYNKHRLITYSRKGKHTSAKKDRKLSSPPREDAALLCLGDAIVVDWSDEGYDALFGGTQGYDDDMRGAPTWEKVPTLTDPDLEEKRRLRSSRKKNGVTLDDCLDEFGKSEILSENDAWYCPRCKEHRRASKKFELWKAPDILVIHLKRFSAQGRFRDKLDLKVDFPIEGLDLSHRLAIHEEGKSPIYDLFAVDDHYGGLGGGHYTAFAKNFLDEKWYEYNDTMVSRRQDPAIVVTSAAYLLFYRRRSSMPLGGPFFEKLLSTTDGESQPTSRASSPAGEGKRLDGSSRNGSSSALRGVGAAHQAGVGGADGGAAPTLRTGVDDELPAYSSEDPNRRTVNPANLANDEPLESMEMDDNDEGLGGPIEGPLNYNAGYSYSLDPSWSFGGLGNPQSTMTVVPPGSDVDEDLFAENSSTKAAGSSNSDGADDRMADFTDDVGTTFGAFGTPPADAIPLLDVPPPMGDEAEGPVAEVMLDEHDQTRLD